MKISLPDEMKQWVMSWVEDGLYPDASAHVCDLIRRDQERAARLAHHQALLTEGIESGASDLSVQDVIARADKEYGRKRYLIAKALWEFVAENRNKPVEQRAPNDADDMESILDADYPAEVATLIALEPFKKR